MAALRAFAAQILAFALTWLLAGTGWLPIAGLGWLPVHTGIALGLTALLRLPWWWWPVQMLFPVLVVAGSGAPVPAWAWLAAAAGAALVFGGGVLTRVPLYLSNQAAVEALAELLPPGGGAMDLGCGTGTVVAGLRRRRPDARVAGIEASPGTWLWARLRCGRGIAFGSLWEAKLDGVDLAYAFLSPEPMARLWDHTRERMRPGALLVSNTFRVPGVTPEREIPLPGRRDARLLVYRIPGAPAAVSAPGAAVDAAGH
ncbi:MAG: hypothetical protein RLZZ127_2561 [Planctomycetota bacterium]|jgi:SAM-dependent methyltransferase